MAYSDQNLVITPNIGSSTDVPKIVFSAANTNTTATITLRAYPIQGGQLSFEGSAGQLFSIVNNLSGTLFSVNDISGIPSISVADTGTIQLAPYQGYVQIANTVTSAGTTTGALVVGGGVGIGGNLNVGSSATISVVNTIVNNNGSHLTFSNQQSSGQTSIGFNFSGTPKASIRVDGNGNFVINAVNNNIYFNADLGTSSNPLQFLYNSIVYQQVLGTTATFTGNHIISTSTNATNTNTGALQVQGGAAIWRDLWVGGNIYSANTLTVSVTTATNLTGGTAGQIPYQTGPNATSFYGPGTAGQVHVSGGTGAPLYQSTLTLAGTTNATSTNTGALIVAGGAGIGGNLWVGGDLYVDGVQTIVNSNSIQTGDKTLTLSTGSTSAALAINAGIQIGSTATPYISWLFDGANSWKSSQAITVTTTATIQSTTNSTSTTTGALIVSGGAGIGGNLAVGGTGVFTGTLSVGAVGSYSFNVVSNSSGAVSEFRSTVGPSDILITTGLYSNKVGVSTTVAYVGPTQSQPLQLLTGNISRVQVDATGTVTINTVSNSISTTTGALVVNGGVGIGGNLSVGGYTYYNGLKTAHIFIKGTGNNNVASNLFSINGATVSSNGTRGLTFITIDKAALTATIVGSYDTYGSATASNSLAAVLNAMTNTQIGVLMSYDAIENQITSTLTNALIVKGLYKLAYGNHTGSRRPYAAIFDAGGSSGTIPSRNVIEVWEGDFANAPQAVISTYIATDGTAQGAGLHGNNLTNVLISGEPNTITPAIIADISSNITINGLTTVTNTTAATAVGTGALQVAGGASISGNLWVGGSINGTITGSISTATNLANGTAGQIPYQSAPGTTTFFGGTGSAGNVLVSNGTGAPAFQNTLTLVGTAAAVSTQSGALQVAGGVGVGGVIYAGSSATISVSSAATNNFGSHLTLSNPSSQSTIGFVFAGTPRGSIRVDSSGNFLLNGTNNTFYFNNDLGTSSAPISLIYGATWAQVSYGGTATFVATATAISTSSGAVQVRGGVGVADSVYVGNRFGYGSGTNVSSAYTFFNASTNSIDTVFG
jgi:hypothetical protein